jgi:hypothetical protein
MTMDDTDIRGLSAADARAYALEFLTALKATERDIAALSDELGVWSRRLELAGAKGATELEAAARAKVDELGARKSQLDAERAGLAMKVARIKEQLPMAAASERSVDADLLLAQLQMQTGEALGGPSAKTESELAALGNEDALAALKRKLTEGKVE